MSALITFVREAWLAFMVMACISIAWSVMLVSVGTWIERRRMRKLQQRQAEALRELSRLSREMGEEL